MRASILALLSATALVSAARADDAPGALFVVSYPRGELVVDGRPAGVRTPVTSHVVAAGERAVAIRWKDGARSDPQRISVMPGKTSHLYFRQEPDRVGEEFCDGAHEDACFGWVTEAIDRADPEAVIGRAEVYLERHPRGGYATIARTIVDSEEIILAEERRAIRLYLGGVACALLLLAGALHLLRRRRA